MGEAYIESQPQIEIPNLNTWRWQAERIAVELIGPEPTGFGLAHRVARFFDDTDWMKFELTQKFIDESYGRGPVPTTYGLNLLEYCEGNIIVEECKTYRAAETGRIFDLDRLRQQLSTVHLYTDRRLRPYGYGLHEGVIKRSDLYKQILLEVFELTRDGIVRTGSSREISNGLLKTMKLIDF